MYAKLIGAAACIGAIYYIFFVRVVPKETETDWVKIGGLFVAGYALTYLFGGKRKDHEGKFFPNMVIVRNTDLCSNDCYHIHHWMWMLFLMICYFALNFLFGYREKEVYKYAVSLFLGASLSEYVKYGADIFRFVEPCYPTCKVQAKK